MIETERLILRPFTLDDAQDLHDLFRRPEVAKWSGTGTPMASVDEARERIGRYATRPGPHPSAGVFAVDLRSSGEMVGMALLVRLPASEGVDRDDMEIGWHFRPEMWGRGYATEAGAALVARAFASGIPELYAVTHPDNTASQAVCRRLGMRDIGLRTEWYDRELRSFCLKGPGEPVK